MKWLQPSRRPSLNRLLQVQRRLSYAIENGGSGATTNPVTSATLIRKELPDWEDTSWQVIADNPTWTDDDVAWDIIRRARHKGFQALLLPMFEESHGQKGRISLPDQSKYYCNKRPHGRAGLQSLQLWFPTARSRLHQHKPGVEAFEELTYRWNFHQRNRFLHLRTGSCSR